MVTIYLCFLTIATMVNVLTPPKLTSVKTSLIVSNSPGHLGQQALVVQHPIPQYRFFEQRLQQPGRKSIFKFLFSSIFETPAQRKKEDIVPNIPTLLNGNP